MRVIVDRIESDMAVLEVDGHFVDWPRSALPPGATEGQVFELRFEQGAAPETADSVLQELRQNGPKGDIIDL